jgi:hypothetical protein
MAAAVFVVVLGTFTAVHASPAAAPVQNEHIDVQATEPQSLGPVTVHPLDPALVRPGRPVADDSAQRIHVVVTRRGGR